MRKCWWFGGILALCCVSGENLQAYIAYFLIILYIAGVLTKSKKQQCIDEVKISSSDTGSSTVQISVLTKRIQDLDAHLKRNHKDKHSRRGLVALVERRRKHLTYLKKKNAELYDSTVQKLGLRK